MPQSDSATTGNLALVTGSKPAPFPGFIKPCLARLKKTAPTSKEWVHEVKIDGSPYMQTVIRYLLRCDLSMSS